MSIALIIAIVVSVLIFEALNFGCGALLGFRGRELVEGVLVVHAGSVVIGGLAAGVMALWGWAL